MNENKLEVGEEYLSIKLNGHDYVVAFLNKDKINDNQPDYKGDGVAVWKRKKGFGKMLGSEGKVL